MRRRRLAARVSVAATFLFALLALAAPSAWAHAQLETTTPADGETVQTSPDQVVLRFSEGVSPPPAAIRVFNANGQRVDAGDAGSVGNPSMLRVHLPARLDAGTYVVAWRATSADGHPVRGAFTFSVGVSATDRTGLIARVVPVERDAGWQATAAVTRWVLYAGALLTAGGVAFLVFVQGVGGSPPTTHDRHAAERGVLARIVTVAALIAAVATVASLAWQAVLTSGLGAAGIGNGRVLVDVLHSGFGTSALLRLSGLVAVMLGVARLSARAGMAAAGVGAVSTIGSFVLTGHTVATSPRVLVSVANLAHAAAGAVWFGGLVLLLVTLRRRKADGDAIGAGELVVRFSRIATIAVVAVVVAGLGLAWSQVRAARALTSTAYGWALLAKMVLVGTVIALGAYNHRRLVPAIAASARGIPDGQAAQGIPHGQGARGIPDGQAAWSTLRRTVRAEAAGVVAVLAVTAVLVNLVPARTAAGVTGPFTATTPMGAYQLNVTVDPNRAGANELHIYLFDPAGQPTDPTAGSGLQVGFSLPSRDIGPITRTATVAGPGHWQMAGDELSIPGQWRLQFQLTVSRFSQLTTALTVPVNP
ncbi:MAG: copper resistance protein CopC [Egibacteraceae bacterium]